jgi:hypothetical protein
MTTPPSSPVLNSNAIVALQIAADDSQTPTARAAHVPAAALAFSDTNKRRPTNQSGGGTNSGPNSSIKKHPDLQESPRLRVGVASDGDNTMDIDLSILDEDHTDLQTSLVAPPISHANRFLYHHPRYWTPSLQNWCLYLPAPSLLLKLNQTTTKKEEDTCI